MTRAPWSSRWRCDLSHTDIRHNSRASCACRPRRALTPAASLQVELQAAHLREVRPLPPSRPSPCLGVRGLLSVWRRLSTSLISFCTFLFCVPGPRRVRRCGALGAARGANRGRRSGRDQSHRRHALAHRRALISSSRASLSAPRSCVLCSLRGWAGCAARAAAGCWCCATVARVSMTKVCANASQKFALSEVMLKSFDGSVRAPHPVLDLPWEIA